MPSIPERVVNRVKLLMQGRLRTFNLYLDRIEGKKGLEIGGPSKIFTPGRLCPVYDYVDSLNNCDFSDSTVWASHQKSYQFSNRKPAGITFFCEGSDLSAISDQSYDFVLSSHNLEHFANPVKALVEWKRVLRPDGSLVLVLPDYRRTFDHRRQPTAVEHMMEDFRRGAGEDDLTHLPEILEKHDLSRDPGAGSAEQFRTRSQTNFANRCLHHHVFDERNSVELLDQVGFNALACELALPFHICILAQVQSSPGKS
jgi:SAM-dependent methyltransferase